MYSDEFKENLSTQLFEYVDECIEKKTTPNIQRFCVNVKFSRATLYTWDDDKINKALDYLKDAQGAHLIEGGLNGDLNARVSCLMLQSNHDMSTTNTIQGNSEKPLHTKYEHDPSKAADEIIAAQVGNKD